MSQISQQIIACAIEVHRQLGPGLLESTYEQCLAHEFSLAEMPFERQLSIPVQYKGVFLNCGYRLDFLVEESVIVELKSVDELLPVHQAQLLTYLKLTGKKTGLLINFNVPLLKHGIRRMVL